MKLKQIIILATVAAALSVVMACSKDKDSGESAISQPQSTKSHNAGENCMTCHKAGGSGEGSFTVAGTVYNNKLSAIFPNAIIKLYTKPNSGGTLRAVISGDAKGNFYTTEKVDFSGGLYPVIFGHDIDFPKYMLQPVTSGACASCHGSSTSELWVD